MKRAWVRDFARWIAVVATLIVLPSARAQNATADTPVESERSEETLETHTIAVVRDRNSPYFDEVIAGFRKELDVLSEDQYRYEIVETGFNAQGDRARVDEVLNLALADQTVDVIYTAGFVSTFRAAKLTPQQRTKPIVGGAVEFIDVSGEQISPDGGSKIPRYTFIQSPRRLAADLEKLAQLSRADTIYAIVDRFAFESLQGIYKPQIDALSASLGVRLEAIPRGETPSQSAEALPADAKAVYVPILSGVTSDFRSELFDALSARGILSMSILGIRDVKIGAFVGLASDDTSALYRRIALNLHQILSGVPTELLPVLLRADDKLTINMRTAAKLGWSPDYETSLAARLLFQDDLFADAEELSLEQAMEMAANLHPDIAAATARARAERFAARSIGASYRPKLDLSGQLGANGTTKRINPSLTPAHAHALSLGVEIRQLLYSNRVNSQAQAQRVVAQAAKLDAESTRLDTEEAVALAFLDVLSAEALYEIEKDNLQIIENNLQLAKLRGEIGAAERAEVFRWQASRAQSNSNLFQRDANRRTARVNLNVSLGVERTRYWKLRDIRLADDDFYFMNETLSGLVTDLASFRSFIEFVRTEARDRSPEIQAFEKNIAAQGILLRERNRRNFLPEVSGVGSFQRSVQGAHRFPSGTQNEWSVGIGFVFPLFDGTRSIDKGQIRSVRDQLSAQRDQAIFLIEQRALAAGYGLGASHPAMLFSRQALSAASNNFDSVQIKYQEGAATILNLLDAQSQLLQQKQSEAVAGYQYLRDVISTQRAIAWFEYSKNPADRKEWTARLKSFLGKKKQ